MGEAGEDPVSKHGDDAFKGLAAGKGTLAERVNAAQKAKDAEFQQTFMVTAQEAAEVKSLAAKAGKDADLSKLPADAKERLDSLYTSINAKVGYSLPTDLGTKPIGQTSDSAANAYIQQVDAQMAAAAAKLQEARLKAFVQAF